MNGRLSRVHWPLVVKTAVAVYIMTFILGVAVSLPLLAFLNWIRLSSLFAAWMDSLAALRLST